MELLDFGTNPDNLNIASDNCQYIVFTDNEKLTHAVWLMTNKCRVHMIVSSINPIITDTVGDYIVILQQKFGENYLSLIKKVLNYEKNYIGTAYGWSTIVGGKYGR